MNHGRNPTDDEKRQAIDVAVKTLDEWNTGDVTQKAVRLIAKSFTAMLEGLNEMLEDQEKYFREFLKATEGKENSLSLVYAEAVRLIDEAFDNPEEYESMRGLDKEDINLAISFKVNPYMQYINEIDNVMGERLENYISSRTGQKYDPAFIKTFMSKATTALNQVPKTKAKPLKKAKKGEERSEKGKPFFVETQNNVNVIVNDDELLTYDQNTKKIMRLSDSKLLDQLRKRGTRFSVKDLTVTLDVDEVMHYMGWKDRKEAMKKLLEAIKTMYNVSLDFSQKIYIVRIVKGKERHYQKEIGGHMRIISSVIHQEQIDWTDFKLEKGSITFSYSLEYATYLQRTKRVVYFPAMLLQTDYKRNPYSFDIGSILLEHMNENLEKPNENRIRVVSIIKRVTDLPYALDPKVSRYVNQRVIKPFVRDLQALKGGIIDYKISDKKGEVISDEQLKSLPYKQFSECLIEFKFIGYPLLLEQRIKAKNRVKKRSERAENKVENDSL